MMRYTLWIGFLPVLLNLVGCGSSGRLSDSEIDRACVLANRCSGASTTSCTRALVDARNLADGNGCADIFARTNRCYLSDDMCSISARCQVLGDELIACGTARPDAGMSDAGPQPPDAAACTQSMCGEECVDTYTNVAHCGGCDQPCDGRCAGGICSPITQGDTCENAPLLPNRDITVVFTLDENYQQDHRSSCSASHDADIAFRWVAPASGVFEVYTTAIGSDSIETAVYGADCSEAAEIACVAGPGSSRVRFTAVSGAAYRLVISSDYNPELSVRISPR